MSQSNTAAPGAITPNATQEPKPATIAELEAAFPNDPKFALSCAKQALTPVESKAAYSDVLIQHNTELAQKNQELQASGNTTRSGRAWPRSR